MIITNCVSAKLGKTNISGEVLLDIVDRKIFLTCKIRPEGRDGAELNARAFWGNECF